jgi:predicted dehydrogenase
MARMNRRRFLQGTLAAMATVTVAGTKSSGQVIGANEMINVAVAGINGRGTNHMDSYAGMQNVRITWLVDPDSRLFDSRRNRVQQRGGNMPQTTQDIRRALEDQNLHVVSIATPNHWHALMTCWAVQAGKDVYVEKPSSHNVHEGRVTVQLARQHNRIVQHGTQSRSSSSWARACAVARSGQLGRLLVARGLCYKRRNSIGERPSNAAPQGVDFNVWLGPAPQQPHHGNLVHYNWHWFWDFGNGDIGNQGVHQMDIARWGIANATLPRRVISLGGRFGYTDQGETPNTQMAVFDYGETQLIFEVRGLPNSTSYRGQGVGNTFHFEGGTIVGSNTFYPTGSRTSAPMPQVNNITMGPGGSNHYGNFIAAVRSRRQADLNADILEGHYSSALGHLANISYRLGQQTAFAPRTQTVNGNEAATETLARLEQHLRDNSVMLQDTTLRVGPMLEFNAQTERFTNNEQANALLTRNYRAPFTLPAVDA